MHSDHDKLKILCFLQFFPEVAQNSLRIPSFLCSEKSLSIPGLWLPCFWRLSSQTILLQLLLVTRLGSPKANFSAIFGAGLLPITHPTASKSFIISAANTISIEWSLCILAVDTDLSFKAAVEADYKRVVGESEDVSFGVHLIHLVAKYEIVLEQFLHCKHLAQLFVTYQVHGTASHIHTATVNSFLVKLTLTQLKQST